MSEKGWSDIYHPSPLSERLRGTIKHTIGGEVRPWEWEWGKGLRGKEKKKPEGGFKKKITTCQKKNKN